MGCGCGKNKSNGGAAAAGGRPATAETLWEVVANGQVKYRSRDKTVAEAKKANFPGAIVRAAK